MRYGDYPDAGTAGPSSRSRTASKRYKDLKIYRRIGSSIIGTIPKVKRSNHLHRSAVDRRSSHLNKLRTERKKYRRRAREQERKQAWEQDSTSETETEYGYDASVMSPGHGPSSLSKPHAERRSRSPILSEGASPSSSAATLDEPIPLRKPFLRKRQYFPTGYLPQLASTIVLCMGNFNIGFSLAYHALADVLPLTEASSLWIQNLFNIGGLIGGLASGFALSKGRKKPLLFTILVLTGSWIMAILAQTSSLVYGSRLISGICAGVITVLTQVYVAEMASPSHRAGHGIIPTCFGLLGTLLCFGLSRALNWNGIAITGAAINAPYFLLLLFYVPESPRHLLSSGRIDSVLTSLRKLRGQSVDVTPELNSMQDVMDLLRLGGKPTLNHLLRKSFFLPVIIGGGLMFFSQFAGIDGVLLYAFSRFNELQAASSFENFPVVILYCVQLLATGICCVCIDRTGRKVFLLISTAASAVAMLVLGTFVLFEDIKILQSNHGLGWIPVSCVIVYTGSYALGLGPLPWLVLGEILPCHHQGIAAAIIATFFWGPSLIITTSFNNMQTTMYLCGTFWFYTIFCVFGYLFVLLVVPDIRQATIEQVQMFFARSDVYDEWCSPSDPA